MCPLVRFRVGRGVPAPERLWRRCRVRAGRVQRGHVRRWFPRTRWSGWSATPGRTRRRLVWRLRQLGHRRHCLLQPVRQGTRRVVRLEPWATSDAEFTARAAFALLWARPWRCAPSRPSDPSCATTSWRWYVDWPMQTTLRPGGSAARSQRRSPGPDPGTSDSPEGRPLGATACLAVAAVATVVNGRRYMVGSA